MRSPPPDILARVPADLRIVEAIADNDLTITAAAEGEGETKRLATFAGTAYTGGRLMLAGYAYPVVVDLAGMKIPANGMRPMLRDHSMGSIVGHTSDIQNSGGSLKVAGIVSGVSLHAQEVVASSGNGFPWQLSIGAKANRMVFVDRGETVEANGRKFSGPLYVARQSTLGEVSFVALGADEGGATARVAASAGSDLEVFAMAFEQWLEAKGFQLADLADAQRGSMQALYDAEQKPDQPGNPPNPPIEAGGKTDPDPILETRSRYGAEIKRISDIERICAGAHRDIQARAVSDGWDSTRTELEVLRASRPKTSGPAGGSAGDLERDLMAQVDEASLLIATGMSEEQAGKFFDQKVMNLAVSKKYRGLTLHGLMDHVLRAAGRDFSGNRKSDAYIEAAFRADLDLRADGGITTLSLANILENAAGKTLLAAYQAVEVVWPYITGIRNHTDFKIHSRYRLDSTGSFRKVGPDGELKHVGLSDAKYSSQLDTYGALISLTRQMSINDDLDAFMEIPTALGRLAAVRLEEAVFVLILSAVNNVFFTSANKNYVTGGTTALSLSSLGTVRQKFRDRVDSNGKPILISPQVLLCGTPLETTANNLWAEEKVMVTTTTDKQQFANNPFKGLYRPYTSPYINNSDIRDESGNALLNQSSTAWALFADPSVRAAVAVAFLNGSQVPTIQSAETDFNILGMQWRSFSDFGVGLEDPNAAVWSAGA